MTAETPPNSPPPRSFSLSIGQLTFGSFMLVLAVIIITSTASVIAIRHIDSTFAELQRLQSVGDLAEDIDRRMNELRLAARDFVTDPGDPQFLKRLGEAKATPEGLDKGRGAYRYRIGGEAFPAGGSLLLDARDGHVIEVETAIPNHLEYDDFRLAQQGVDDGGAPAWRALLLSHFEGCETAN